MRNAYKNQRPNRSVSKEHKKTHIKQVTESKEHYKNDTHENFSFEKGEGNINTLNSKNPEVKSNQNNFNNKIGTFADLDADIDDSDFEMPIKAIQCRMKKITKIKGNKRVKTIRRVFKMQDGTEEIHEDVIVERV